MKRFIFVILIVISCGEPVDIEATIDARALKISMENISKISTATPQPQPTAQPTATPQPTATVVPFDIAKVEQIAEEKVAVVAEQAYSGDMYIIEEALPELVPLLAPQPTPQPTATPQPMPTPQTFAGSDAAYKIYQENRQKVLMIEVGNSTGTGWVIEDGWIITNEHVVGSNKSVIVHIPMSSEGSGYTSFAGNVFGVDRKRDLAAIKLDHGLEPIKTREVDVRDIGKEVFTLGYSAGNAGVPSSHSGILSYVKVADTTLNYEKGTSYYKGDELGTKVSIIVFDAAADPGDSGGPIIDKDGFAIGTVYGFLESAGGKRTTGQQMGTNMASIYAVWEDLKNNKNTSFD